MKPPKIRGRQLREAVSRRPEIGIHFGFFLTTSIFPVLHEKRIFRVPAFLGKKPVDFLKSVCQKMSNSEL